MANDPRNAGARAKGATNADNQNTDWSNVARDPILYEQKIQGVTVDMRAPKMHFNESTGRWTKTPPTFTPSRVHPSLIYRLDRQLGTKTFLYELPPRDDAMWPSLAKAA